MRMLSVVELEAMMWTCVAIAVAITAGRLIIRFRKLRRLGTDDYLASLATLFMLAFAITWQEYTPPDYAMQLFKMKIIKSTTAVQRPARSMKLNLANGIMFWCTMYTVKASFLALYWSIFQVSKGFRKAWFCACIYMVLSFIVTILIRLFPCGRVQDVVNAVVCKAKGPSMLIPMQVTWLVLDCVGDMILVAIPLAMLNRMMLARVQKLQISALFGLVAINILLDTLRCTYTIIRDLNKMADQNQVWSTLQVTTAVVLCSLPCYGSLFKSRPKPEQPILKTYSDGSDGKGQWGSGIVQKTWSDVHIERKDSGTNSR